ncbi:MAG: RHS repeat-associated core domain-containing protein [bacterium]
MTIPFSSLGNGKAFEFTRVVNKIESPPAEKVTITSKTSYVYGNGQLWVKLEENPLGSPAKPYYYHNDHLGSARVISDKDGKVVEQYFYYPFGGGGPVGGPTFTGKELDATGLFYFGARYYDPALGRFITPDPVQIPGDNPYVYCANNPLRYIDPNGEWFVPLITAIVKGAVWGAVVGGVSAAITGGDIWEGIKIGAMGGALGGGLLHLAGPWLPAGSGFGATVGRGMMSGAIYGASYGAAMGWNYGLSGSEVWKMVGRGAFFGAVSGAVVGTLEWGIENKGWFKESLNQKYSTKIQGLDQLDLSRIPGDTKGNSLLNRLGFKTGYSSKEIPMKAFGFKNGRFGIFSADSISGRYITPKMLLFESALFSGQLPKMVVIDLMIYKEWQDYITGNFEGVIKIKEWEI